MVKENISQELVMNINTKFKEQRIALDSIKHRSEVSWGVLSHSLGFLSLCNVLIPIIVRRRRAGLYIDHCLHANTRSYRKWLPSAYHVLTPIAQAFAFRHRIIILSIFSDVRTSTFLPYFYLIISTMRERDKMYKL